MKKSYIKIILFGCLMAGARVSAVENESTNNNTEQNGSLVVDPLETTTLVRVLAPARVPGRSCFVARDGNGNVIPRRNHGHVRFVAPGQQ